MVAAGGEHLSEIKTKLLEESAAFSFVQAVRLLLHELSAPGNVNAGTADMQQILEKQIRIRPELSLRFPGTDITDIEKTGIDLEKYLITATFLGLYGASSPLPTFYTEDLINEWNEEKSIKREFLDVINYTLYPIVFKIWSKYRLFYKICEEQDSRATNMLYCFLGLENDHLRQQIRHIKKFFRYTGLALQLPRSAEGLVAMIEDCFDLKDHVFRIVFFQADAGRLHRFLPDRTAFVELSQLVNFYVNQSLEIELVVVLKKDEVETARLGETAWSNLGWNTWLLSEKKPIGKARTAFTVK